MTRPDYSSCTLEELRDVAAHIDQAEYPERYAEVQHQIALREQGTGPDPADTSGSENTAEQMPGAHEVTFTGSGGEFFRIWIVNLLLSLVTLGIYSAWATVRNRRYLYGNTDLDGSRFDFHGSPLAILKGRVIAVVLFIAYAFGGDFHFAIPLVALSVLFLGFPWIMVTALRFRLSNTSWKSLRFGFTARPAEAYRLFALPALVMLTAYAGMIVFAFDGFQSPAPPSMPVFLGWTVILLLVSAWVIPVLTYRARTLIMNNVRYGNHAFTAKLRSSVFFTAFFQALGLGFAAFLVIAVVMFLAMMVLFPFAANAEGGLVMGFVFVVIYGLAVPLYLLPFAAWHVLTTNHVISSAQIENLRFNMAMQVFGYWSVLVSNAIVAVLSLGLAIPWTKVRMLKY
ncbi:MAG: DUF898 domain-containing protein, partial [Xanthomonadales bacterium]|nr:DUF898 domain-containing protein [Xanthomonadales bacterium]NNE06625.1 DUF898 domain-containing protein [Xanthomonadales bacterium]